jgi:hypothetical protein
VPIASARSPNHQIVREMMKSNHFHELVREREVTTGFLDDAVLKKMLLFYGKKYGRIEFMFQENIKTSVTREQHHF